MNADKLRLWRMRRKAENEALYNLACGFAAMRCFCRRFYASRRAAGASVDYVATISRNFNFSDWMLPHFGCRLSDEQILANGQQIKA
jgi:hypothetical protein